jgi:hypothetical protein
MCIPSVQFFPLIIDISFNIHIHLCILSVHFFLKISFFTSKFIYVFHHYNVLLKYPYYSIFRHRNIKMFFLLVSLKNVVFFLRQNCDFSGYFVQAQIRY